MILQALCEYYDRKGTDPDTALAPFGFEEKAIPFFIIIDAEGKFIALADEREFDTKGKPVAKSYLVPKAKGRSGAKSYATANCLWDHYGYLVKQSKVDKPDAIPTEKEQLLAERQHDSFKSVVSAIAKECPADPGVNAVHKFLASPIEVEKVKSSEHWPEVLKIKGCNLSFKLAARTELVCQSTSVINWVKNRPLNPDDVQDGICLVTGQQTQIVRLHDQVAGVNQKPAPLASINDDAYNSYSKSKAFNFPVGVEANFKYTTALNYLLSKASQTRFRVGDTSYVCWASKQNKLEKSFPALFSPSEDPDAGATAVKSLFSSLHNGAYEDEDGNDLFYVLALSPNSARISIRFWHVATIKELSESLGQWFEDLRIEGVEHFGKPLLKNLLST